MSKMEDEKTQRIIGERLEEVKRGNVMSTSDLKEVLFGDKK